MWDLVIDTAEGGRVHESSHNATIPKTKDVTSTGKAKIQPSASNKTYLHMLKKEY